MEVKEADIFVVQRFNQWQIKFPQYHIQKRKRKEKKEESEKIFYTLQNYP